MKAFQRKIENFTCKNCKIYVKGNGYTNHCPQCLWSKHVDVNPGDREEKCEGMMKPVKILSRKGKNIIVHKCINCNFEKRNKVEKEDNFDLIIKISSCCQFDID